MRYLVFDDVLCINLDHRKDRWKNVNKVFNPVGIFPTRIPAVYGKEKSRKYLSKFTTSLSAQFCPKSAIGCAMSHQKAWQNVIERNLKSALILEDDSFPLDNFKEKLLLMWQQVPQDWDIVYLGSQIWSSSNIIKHDILKKNEYISQNIMIPAWAAMTHGYAISNKGAKKILAGTTPIMYHIDTQMNILFQNNKDIKVYCIKPDLIKQNMETSYSDNQNDNKTIKMFNNVVKNIKIDDVNLDTILNSLVFSVGDTDFSTGNIITGVFLIILILISSKKLKNLN